MSDVAEAPTPVVEAPVEAPVIEPVAEPVVPDTRTVPERMEAIRERGRGVRDESTLAEAVNERAVLNAADQKVDPDSRKFVEGDTPLAEITEQPVEEPVAPEVLVTEADELTVKAVPEGFIEIPLPEGHPLRARGLEKLPFPADQEEYGRSVINQAVSQKEVETLRARTVEAERIALENRTETEFWRDSVGEVFGSDYQAKYHDLKETYGEEDAELYRQGKLGEAQAKVAEMRDQAFAEARQARQVEHGRAFGQLAERDALYGDSPRYPGWSMDGTHGMNEAFAFYGKELDALEGQTGKEELPNAEGWHRVAEMFYQSHPAGLQAKETRDAGLRESLRKEVEGEAAKKEKEALEAARTTAATNPLANLPPVETGQTTTSGEVPMTTPEKLAEIRRRGMGRIP